MNEDQAWRPSPAPKPSPAKFKIQSPAGRLDSTHPSNDGSRKSPVAGKTTSQTAAKASSQNNSSNAVLAALTAAGKIQSRPVQQDGIGARVSTSPVRGQSQLSAMIQRGKAEEKVGNDMPGLERSTSAVAACIASARTSPAGSKETSPVRRLSPHRQLQPVRTHDSASITPNGTKQSTTARPDVPAPRQTGPGGRIKSTIASDKKLDLDAIPVLSQKTVGVTESDTAIMSHADASAQLSQPRPGSTTLRKPTSGAPGGHGRAKPPPPEPRKMSTTSSPSIRLSPSQSETKVAALAQRFASSQDSIDGGPTTAPVSLSPPPRASAQSRSPSNRHTDFRSGMTASTLADAMVASSLAATRAPSRGTSPVRMKPPAVPRRRSRSLTSIGSSPKKDVKALQPSPTPIRPMRHTLRKQSPGHSEDEDTKRGRKHWVRKHPNKHKEGDRKRWRDKITDSERKRYEGVWAANKGLLQEHEIRSSVSRKGGISITEQDLVLNIVVRDIWDRSRLPPDVLEEVWELVAPSGASSLGREEFVVGLWLIDQRLKGRKLPLKVSPSVWASVRHSQGIKIRNKPL